MTNFDADTLSALREGREVRIRTGKHPESTVVIWVVVAGDAVLRAFVPRRQGGAGTGISRPEVPPTLEVGRPMASPCRRFPADDPASIERASRAFLAKYQPSPYAQAMVKADLLPTTLRLETTLMSF